MSSELQNKPVLGSEPISQVCLPEHTITLPHVILVLGLYSSFTSYSLRQSKLKYPSRRFANPGFSLSTRVLRAIVLSLGWKWDCLKGV